MERKKQWVYGATHDLFLTEQEGKIDSIFDVPSGHLVGRNPPIIGIIRSVGTFRVSATILKTGIQF
jgi:hypothetical protein